MLPLLQLRIILYIDKWLCSIPYSGACPYRSQDPSTLHRSPRRLLCTEALAAETEADVERIIPELRAALHEHVKLAKDSLEGQVSAIAALDTFKAPAV